MIAVRATSGVGLTGTALNCPVPTVVNDDQLIAVVAGRGSGTMTCIQPAGWTEILNQPRSTSGRLFVYRKLAAGEPGSYTFTLSQSSTQVMGMVSLPGVDKAAPVNASQSAQGASSVSHVCPAVTTTVGDALLLRITMSAASVLPLSWTWPAQATEVIDRNFAGTGAGGIAVAIEPLAAPGDSGTRTATCAQALVPATATIALTPTGPVGTLGYTAASRETSATGSAENVQDATGDTTEGASGRGGASDETGSAGKLWSDS